MRIPERPGIYVRISNDEDGERDGVTRQRKDTEAHRQRIGWGEAVVYEDNDISASKGLARPAYEQLLRDCEQGLRDGIICFSTDRLTRRMSELVTFLEWREKIGVAYTDTEGADTTTASGIMVIQIKGAVAEAEARRISERTRRANDQRAERGIPFWSGHRPFGYLLPDYQTVPEEHERIREAAAAVLNGMSLGSICRQWDTDRVPTVGGGQWSRRTLYDILVKPRIAGLMAHRGVIVGPGQWEAALDRETWEAVRALLTGGKGSRLAGATDRKHLLSGICVCGICGHPMASGARETYRCSKATGGCGGVSRLRAPIDKMVTALVLAKTAELDVMEPEEDPDAVLRQQIVEAEDALVRLRESDLPDEDMFPLLRKRREKLTALRAELTGRVATAALTVGEDPEQWWGALTLAEKRAAVLRVMSGVVIKPTGRTGRRGFVAEAVVPLPYEEPSGLRVADR